MGDSDVSTLDSSVAVALTGKIMVISIIVLFVVVVFVVLLHVYARRFWWRIEEEEEDNSTRPQQRRHRERRFVFAPAGQQLTAAARRGLDPTILKSLPVRVFQAKEFEEGLECAVCLCELEEGEKARLLPKCNHGFHLECIDMWFQSHTTCPICRNSVAPDFSSVVDSDATFRSVEENFGGVREVELTESPNLPANVLFWGDENEVNSRNAAAAASSSMEEGAASSSSSMLMIDIPRQVMEELHCSSPSELQSPISKRLRSLRRLLSMADRKASPSSQSSNCADVDAMA